MRKHRPVPPTIEHAPIAPEAPAVPMPTVENAPACAFSPAAGIGAADVFEITLMYLLELTQSPASVSPGGLRGILLSAPRVEQLSDSARRFMTPPATT